MADAHAIRQPRRPGTEPFGEAREGPRSLPNPGAMRRSMRTFSIFALADLAILLVLVGLTLASPSPGVRTSGLDLGLYGLLFLILLGVAFALTIVRTPKGVRRDGKELLLVERFGPPVALSATPPATAALVKRLPMGLGGPAPTDLLRITLPNGRSKLRYVDAGLVPGPGEPSGDRAGG